MDTDDRQIGRILSRREVLGLLGAGALALVGDKVAGGSPGLAHAQEGAAAGLPACIVTPEQAEGPFFVDERLNRADIRADTASGEVKPGAPLLLSLRVFRIGTVCEPLPGATVDVWHCDALGVYSDVRDRFSDTVGQDFLRGFQRTDEGGEARFMTIYPGWYPGRAAHIHFKVRADSPAGGPLAFTSQFYFDDALSARVYAREPYAAKGASGWLSNAQDGIYRNGGEALQLDVAETAAGYAASFDIGLLTES